MVNVNDFVHESLLWHFCYSLKLQLNCVFMERKGRNYLGCLNSIISTGVFSHCLYRSLSKYKKCLQKYLFELLGCQHPPTRSLPADYSRFYTSEQSQIHMEMEFLAHRHHDEMVGDSGKIRKVS